MTRLTLSVLQSKQSAFSFTCAPKDSRRKRWFCIACKSYFLCKHTIDAAVSQTGFRGGCRHFLIGAVKANGKYIIVARDLDLV